MTTSTGTTPSSPAPSVSERAWRWARGSTWTAIGGAADVTTTAVRGVAARTTGTAATTTASIGTRTSTSTARRGTTPTVREVPAIGLAIGRGIDRVIGPARGIDPVTGPVRGIVPVTGPARAIVLATGPVRGIVQETRAGRRRVHRTVPAQIRGPDPDPVIAVPSPARSRPVRDRVIELGRRPGRHRRWTRTAPQSARGQTRNCAEECRRRAIAAQAPMRAAEATVVEGPTPEAMPGAAIAARSRTGPGRRPPTGHEAIAAWAAGSPAMRSAAISAAPTRGGRPTAERRAVRIRRSIAAVAVVDAV